MTQDLDDLTVPPPMNDVAAWRRAFAKAVRDGWRDRDNAEWLLRRVTVLEKALEVSLAHYRPNQAQEGWANQYTALLALLMSNGDSAALYASIDLLHKIYRNPPDAHERPTGQGFDRGEPPSAGAAGVDGGV